MDLPVLVDRVLAGHGTPGTSLLPPFHANWHVPPAADAQRSFDLQTADEKLVAAGYEKDASGQRLDKEGKPISLRLTWPASESELATAAQFITEWWGELGIPVDAGVTEDDTLLDDLAPPEYDPPGKADFDVYMWGWVGDVDPTSLLQPFTTDEIGGSSDTFYSNPRYDELFTQQGQTTDEAERKAMLQEMQEIFYGIFRTSPCTTTPSCTPTGRTSSAVGRTSPRTRGRRCSGSARSATRSSPWPAARPARRRRRVPRRPAPPPHHPRRRVAAGRPPPTTRRSSWERAR